MQSPRKRAGNEPPLQAALKYLSARARTESEVRKKLETSGYSKVHITATLEQLRSYGYVDDEAFARDWAQSRMAHLGYGPRLLKQELCRRGVESAVVDQILRETFDRSKELEQAKALLEQRFGREDLSSGKTLQRAGALLARRGYHRSVIEDVLAPHCTEF